MRPDNLYIELSLFEYNWTYKRNFDEN